MATQKKVSRRGLWIALAAIALTAMVGIVALTMAVVYGGGRENALTRAVERVVPLPVAIVGRWHMVPLAELRENLQATRVFYENQDFESIGVRVDFTTEDGQKRLKLWERTLLDKLVEDEVVMLLAKREGIEVTDEQVHARVMQFLERYGTSQAAAENVRNLWGFTIRDFEQKVVKPQIYREMLEEAVRGKVDTSAQRERILGAQAELGQGAEFADVARKYLDGATADTPIQAAWFRRDDLLPEIAEKAFSLPVGSRSDVIETAAGFHIVSVDDRQTRLDGEQVLLRNIAVMKPAFAVWLDARIREIPVSVLLRDYVWNTETFHVDLRDDELRAFAEKALSEIVAPAADMPAAGTR